ncbi:hypothetical protein AGMMS49521_1760 [Campylobacterota bacterium]|nr:hypothetical protein AGMMS49521_1760 [Campylobacterota bacterium]
MWNSYNICAFVVNCFVALGTCGAVIVALWQARRGYKAIADIHFMVGTNLSNGDISLAVAITNKGVRPITIVPIPSFYFANYSADKSDHLILQPKELTSPVTIAPFKRELFPLESYDEFIKDCIEYKFNIKKTKLFVCFESGETFEVKQFREYKQKYIKDIQQARQTKSPTRSAKRS